ncbi:MAG: squalene--hopene cyclase [Thermogemmata sp.]|nr:squalene--hopene cyclase [Thermogemmata sp.]
MAGWHTRPTETPRWIDGLQDGGWWEEVSHTVERARQALLAQQRPDGHWRAELQGDTILESEFILLLAIVGQRDDPRLPKLANYIRRQQMAEGGWSTYPGGPPDVSVSVKAYLALKIAGDSAEAAHMQRAAAVIRRLGGAAAVNSFTRFYLAALGQIPYDACPTVPPELILLPRWFPINIYAMSAWSRTIFVPLSIVNAYKPVTPLPEAMHIRELFLTPPEEWPLTCGSPAEGRLSWRRFFVAVDRVLKFLERHRLTPWRARALDRALVWIRERCQDSDGLGAIFPPMLYHVLVLHCLGKPASDPEWQWAMAQLTALAIEEQDTLRVQPCLSPVWDTALAVHALVETPTTEAQKAVSQAVNWLLQRDIRQVGDWARRVRGVEPGGWCFEYRNPYYPDVDDTAMVLLALARSGAARSATAVVTRACRWLLAMQNRNGGWAAFDRGIDNPVLEKVPFADHNAMLDPACPDITGRVLEALSYYGYRRGHPVVDRAVHFLLTQQTDFGAWSGRWGVNYLYGTWQVLSGLSAVGYDHHLPVVRRAVRWLKEVQNGDGGWGESCRSYDDPTWAGRGDSTASQTAWAILALLAAGEGDSPEARAGVEFLLGTQKADGSWREEAFTGTGFPRVFYLKYHLYPLYFPLLALSRYLRHQPSDQTGDVGQPVGVGRVSVPLACPTAVSPTPVNPV